MSNPGAEAFQQWFLGSNVEVVMNEYNPTNPIRGVTYPNTGILVGYDANGVVIQRGKDDMAFFPFTFIRCIRRVEEEGTNAVAPAVLTETG